MTEIAVIVPVLGRPAAALPLAMSLADATSVPYRLVFVCSPDDHAEISACRYVAGELGADVITVDWQPGHGDYQRKLNLATRFTDAAYIFQAADDIEFRPGWDTAALRAIRGFGVCGTNDNANPLVKRGQHSTHSLIDRDYIDVCGASMDGPGTVMSEAYWHQWCDNELVAVARQRGCFAFAADSLVPHVHPIWRTAPDDDTYRKGSAQAADDARLFRERRRLWEGVAA